MLTLATRIAWIATHLRDAIGVFAARQSRAPQTVILGAQAYAPSIPPNQPPKLPNATWLLFWNRLGRLSTRFQTLFARWRTNTLPRHRLRPPRLTRPAADARPAAPRLPCANGWVNHRIPESSPSTAQLDALLRDPEARALVEAAPQAGRLLRPLCRALGVPQPDWLRLPRRPRKPRRPSPSPPPHQAAQTHPPATADRPLPPAIRAAARAWRQKYG